MVPAPLVDRGYICCGRCALSPLCCSIWRLADSSHLWDRARRSFAMSDFISLLRHCLFSSEKKMIGRLRNRAHKVVQRRATILKRGSTVLMTSFIFREAPEAEPK